MPDNPITATGPNGEKVAWVNGQWAPFQPPNTEGLPKLPLDASEMLKQLLTAGGTIAGGAIGGPPGAIAGGALGRTLGHVPEALQSAATGRPNTGSFASDPAIGAMEGAAQEFLPGALKIGGKGLQAVGEALSKGSPWLRGMVGEGIGESVGMGRGPGGLIGMAGGPAASAVGQGAEKAGTVLGAGTSKLSSGTQHLLEMLGLGGEDAGAAAPAAPITKSSAVGPYETEGLYNDATQSGFSDTAARKAAGMKQPFTKAAPPSPGAGSGPVSGGSSVTPPSPSLYEQATAEQGPQSFNWPEAGGDYAPDAAGSHKLVQPSTFQQMSDAGQFRGDRTTGSFPAENLLTGQPEGLASLRPQPPPASTLPLGGPASDWPPSFSFEGEAVQPGDAMPPGPQADLSKSGADPRLQQILKSLLSGTQ